MSEELKPCHDGADLCPVAVVRVRNSSDNHFKGYRAVCFECGDRGPIQSTPEQAITAWNTRAEERARAECAADTRRLEWLEKLPFADVRRLPNGWEICINNVRHWDMRPTLREAIDVAMEGGNG